MPVGLSGTSTIMVLWDTHLMEMSGLMCRRGVCLFIGKEGLDGNRYGNLVNGYLLGEEMNFADCNKKVFDEGECVAVTGWVSKEILETLVQSASRLTGQPMDWHYAGGRGRVLALGDIDEAKRMFTEMLKLTDNALVIYDEESC